MKYSWLVISCFLLTGCLASNALTYESKATTNQYHLVRVRKGMSEKQILQIMHKPYSYETFQADDDIYDVWFYVTRATGLDQTRMVTQNLTPLTFKNGILVGTGYSWYYYAMKAQSMELEAQRPAPVIKKPKQSVEDKAFEKALRAPGKPTEITAPQESEHEAQPTHTKEKAHPVHVEKKTPIQHKVNPTPHHPEKENLPPNVHIIGDAEPPLSCNPCPDADCGPSCSDPPPLYCGPCQEEKCSPNRFAVLDNGMTELQVYQAFGAPMSHETFVYNGHAYDAWFYETHPSITGMPSVVPQHLTTLTFKDAVLISKSDDEFYKLKAKIENQYKIEREIAAAKEEAARRGPPKFIKPYVAAKALVSVSIKDFSKVRKGMSESQVSSQVGSPMAKESYLVGNDVYEIWFYQIDLQKKNKESKHIPVTFKNGVVVGITMNFYNDVRKEAGHECIDCYTPEADRMIEDESEQNFNYW